MTSLIYAALASLDGYTVDASGSFDWAMPDEEVHRFVNDLSRPFGTMLLGRRMYDTLAVWDTMALDEAPEHFRDYQSIWKATDKVVYSRSLSEARTARTRIEPAFVPEDVRALKAQASRDLSIGGPEIAAEALRAGLVDEIQLVLSPVSVGSGTAALPSDLRLDLELLDERRFGNGAVFVRYRPR